MARIYTATINEKTPAYFTGCTAGVKKILESPSLRRDAAAKLLDIGKKPIATIRKKGFHKQELLEGVIGIL